MIEYKQEGFRMFEQMMEETNQETLKRIFRTDLSSVKTNSMSVNQRARNLKMKNDQENIQNISPEKMVDQSQNALSPSQNFQSKALNKRTPIKVDKKVGRNEPCPCGSGKKYKKCHG